MTKSLENTKAKARSAKAKAGGTKAGAKAKAKPAKGNGKAPVWNAKTGGTKSKTKPAKVDAKKDAGFPVKPSPKQKSRPKSQSEPQPNPVRIRELAVCPLAQECGACSFVNEPYIAQLSRKDAEMRALFAEADVDASLVRPILGMRDPFHYRNKVASPFAPGKARTEKGAGGSGKALTNKAGEAKREASKMATGKAGRAQSGSKGSSEILTGMYAAGTHKLVDTQGCAVENADANAVVQAVKRIMRKYGMTPYNEDTGAGFMRHVVVRVGHTSGEMLVVLVTNGVEFTSAKNFCRELVKACPKVTTVVQNINLRQTNVILGEESRTLYGPGFILDSLCGVSFRISPTSFYQVNAVQTEVLYRTAIEAAGLTGKETVIDAYCGTGTIGLVAAAGLPAANVGLPTANAELPETMVGLPVEADAVAEQLGKESASTAYVVLSADGARTPGAKRVIGVDNVPDAIRDAVQNAKHNGITRAEFVCADATEFLKELAYKGKSSGVSLADGEPLVLLMDPPRAGSTPEFLHATAALSPERIVYISCNPQTQVRDIRQLQESGYHVEIVQPVDMFPHTPHVETVVLLSKS